MLNDVKQTGSSQACSVVGWGGEGERGGGYVLQKGGLTGLFPAPKCTHALYHMEIEAALHAIMGHLAVTG